MYRMKKKIRAICNEAVSLSLRKQAEDCLLLTEIDANAVDGTDYRRLLRELQAHQIELEMQLAELRKAHAKSRALVARLRASETQLRLGFDYSYDWEYWQKPDRGIAYMSTSCEDITGIPPAEFVANHRLLRRIVHPDDRAIMNQHIRETAVNRADAQLEFRIKNPSGEVRYIAHRCRAVISPEGVYMGRRVSNRDITERKQIELKLMASESRYKTLFETASDAIFIMSGEVFVDCNAATLDMFRCTREQIINKPPYDFSPAIQPDGRDSLSAAREKIHAALQGRTMLFEWWHQRADGEVFYAEVSLHAFRIETDDFIVAIVRDINKRKLLEQQLEKQAHTDVLTGLNSRGHLLALLEREIKRAKRYNSPLSVAMLDLDHFKAVNDNHGHHAGDMVLKAFARVCLEVLRKIDVIGRVGGEEFVVLFPETTLEQALEVAERLRQAIAAMNVRIESGLCIRFTVSMGLAALDNNDINLDGLLTQADKALYQAKYGGRNKVCCFSAG